MIRDYVDLLQIKVASMQVKYNEAIGELSKQIEELNEKIKELEANKEQTNESDVNIYHINGYKTGKDLVDMLNNMEHILVITEERKEH